MTLAGGPTTAKTGVETPSRYEAVIGIEVHCQLRTASKMFCGCSTDIDGKPANSRTCPVCLGLPGSLPTINRRAVEHVLTTGLAVGATIPDATRWDRKNYFYPDLPKGYQISQFELPLASGGGLTIETAAGPASIRFRRAHLEEDTARLIHAVDAAGRRISLIDFNRSGIPLMEVVTEPDLRSAEAARRYAEELRLLLRTIGASNAEMENGQLRVEANVSLRVPGDDRYGTRIEIKNMNSFRSVERAIAHEIERQAAALDAGEPLVQETRGWDDTRGRTYVMRSKEESHDYRYFPEPDLPPLRVDRAWLGALMAGLPELPAARRSRYRDSLGLSAYDAWVVVADEALTVAFDAVAAADPAIPAKEVANWITGEYARLAKEHPGPGSGHLIGRAVAPEIADLIGRVLAGEVSRANAKELLRLHLATGRPIGSLVTGGGMSQISDAAALDLIVREVLAANPGAAADVRAGKTQAVRFLVGQVMKATRGQANAALVQEAVRGHLLTDRAAASGTDSAS